nr:MAK10-like protein [Tanacetum cinerariifolium]
MCMLMMDEDHFESMLIAKSNIWMAFEGNTHDLGSIEEETDKTKTLHRSLLKNSVQCLETTSRFLATPSHLTSDGVKISKTASERSRLERNPRRFSRATASKTLRRRALLGYCKTPYELQNPYQVFGVVAWGIVRDENPIRTLKGYSKPSHEGYRNIIEIPVGNNVVPLRSDTIWLVQNGCSFHKLLSEDPNQHLKDFLKLVDLLDLDVANREMMRLNLFQFSLHDQAGNWLERLPTRSISTHNTTENLWAYTNVASIDHHKKEELQSKGIKSPSKLLTAKYLSQSTLDEQNRNSSSPKHIYFINSIVILNKEREAREEENVRPNVAIGQDRNITIKAKRKLKRKVERSLRKRLKKKLKRKRTTTQNTSTRFPQLNYYWIMSEGLKSRKKPSNREKINNFIERVKGLKVFVGNFTYECDFVMLEDTNSVIDPYLGGMVLGRPFIKETGLVYDKDEGTVTFKKEGEKIIFKMPHKMEMFKHIDKDILKTDNILSFIMTGDDGNQKKLTTQAI